MRVLLAVCAVLVVLASVQAALPTKAVRTQQLPGYANLGCGGPCPQPVPQAAAGGCGNACVPATTQLIPMPAPMASLGGAAGGMAGGVNGAIQNPQPEGVNVKVAPPVVVYIVTYAPTFKPSFTPTGYPTSAPTFAPTSAPTYRPTWKPSLASAPPSSKPTFVPTSAPTYNPTSKPTYRPTSAPTNRPTSSPTSRPTGWPSFRPSGRPSNAPTGMPTTDRFYKAGWVFQRVKVNGHMSSTNIRKACNAKKLVPACDHTGYNDGYCVPFGHWHLSYPGHDRQHGIPVSKARGAFFYTSHHSRSLYNTGRTHRWSSGNDRNGYTYCVSSTFSWHGKKLYRVPFRGVARRHEMKRACRSLGMRPVCDHKHYWHHGVHDKRSVWTAGHWHFSHPHHDRHHKVPVYKVRGAYFYVGHVNHGWALQNTGHTHRWANGNDRNGQTFCTK